MIKADINMKKTDPLKLSVYISITAVIICAAAFLIRFGFDFNNSRDLRKLQPEKFLQPVKNPVQLVIKTGHKAKVKNIALSPDGKTLLSGDVFGNLKLWDFNSGELIRNFEGVPGIIYSLAFSPDGKTCAVGTLYGRVGVWEVSTGRILASYENMGNQIAFSPDGRTFAGACNNQPIKLYEIKNSIPQPKEFLQFQNSTGYTSALDFSPDGKLLASGDGSGEVKIWDIASGSLLKNLEGLHFWVHSVRFSPDGTKLTASSYVLRIGKEYKDLLKKGYKLSGTDQRGGNTGSFTYTLEHFDDKDEDEIIEEDGGSDDDKPAPNSPDSPDNCVIVWDISAGAPLLKYPHTKAALCSIFSPDGKLVASSGNNNGIEIWDIAGKKKIKETAFDNARFLNSIAFTPDGRELVVASGAGVIRVIDASTMMIKKMFGRTEAPVKSVSFSPDGSAFASGGEDRIIRIWDPKNGVILHQLEGHRGAITDIKHSGDGNYMVSSDANGAAIVWDARTGRQIGELNTPDFIPLITADIDPKTQTIITGDAYGYIRLISYTSKKELWKKKIHRRAVSSLKISPDCKTFLAGAIYDGMEDNIKLCGIQTGETLKSYSGCGNGVWSLNFIPDTNTFTAAGGDTVRLWDLDTGKPIREFKGHKGAIWTSSVSPDGKYMVSGGFRGDIKLWDINTGNLIHNYQGHEGEIESLSFGLNNNFVSGSSDSTARLWNTSDPSSCLMVFMGFRQEIYVNRPETAWIVYDKSGSFTSSQNAPKFIEGASINGKYHPWNEYKSQYQKQPPLK
jgi:WD40 repeat protein